MGQSGDGFVEPHFIFMMPATGGDPALPGSVHRALLAGVLEVGGSGERLKPLVGKGEEGAGHVAGRGRYDDSFSFLMSFHGHFGFVCGAFGFGDEFDFFGIEVEKLGQFEERFLLLLGRAPVAGERDQKAGLGKQAVDAHSLDQACHHGAVETAIGRQPRVGVESTPQNHDEGGLAGVIDLSDLEGLVSQRPGPIGSVGKDWKPANDEDQSSGDEKTSGGLGAAKLEAKEAQQLKAHSDDKGRKEPGDESFEGFHKGADAEFVIFQCSGSGGGGDLKFEI